MGRSSGRAFGPAKIVSQADITDHKDFCCCPTTTSRPGLALARFAAVWFLCQRGKEGPVHGGLGL